MNKQNLYIVSTIYYNYQTIGGRENMNEKEFKNILCYWKYALKSEKNNSKEVLTSFLKRGLRANKRQETDIKKISDKQILNARQVLFIEKISGVKFLIIITDVNKKVSLIY